MNDIQSLLYLFALVAYSNAGCCTKVCVLDDMECVTKGAQTLLRTVVAGVKGEVEPMDPLYINGMDSSNESSPNAIANIELRGLKNCVVTLMRINMTYEDYEQRMNCPKLMVILNYDANETGSSLKENKIIITAYDYKILNAGHYGILIGEKDLLPHFFIKSVFTNVSEECCNEIPTLNIQRLSYTENKESLEQMDDFPKETGAFILSMIMKKAMIILFEGIDAHSRKHSMGDMLPGSNMRKRHKNHKP